jgi:hypothetical protein
MIEKAYFDDVEEILSVINTSNREAYRNIIPKEHFREPVLSLEKILEDSESKLKVKKLEGFTGSMCFQNIKGEESGQLW